MPFAAERVKSGSATLNSKARKLARNFSAACLPKSVSPKSSTLTVKAPLCAFALERTESNKQMAKIKRIIRQFVSLRRHDDKVRRLLSSLQPESRFDAVRKAAAVLLRRYSLH